jgi:hypothetical protein
MSDDLFTARKPLAQILDIPDKVTSVYSMVQHIWAGDNEEAREKNRKANVARIATVDEFFLDPVRSYLERFLGDVADGEGQGYWMLAHFGVGKSHLMAVEAILAIGGEKVWDLVKKKEDEVKNLGPAARLDRFRDKIAGKKVFPVIFSLEGKGGGGTGKRLSDFILEEARAMFELRTGKPLAITGAHHLAEWYLQGGRKDFENSMKEFLGNKRLMDALPKYEGYNDWLSALQTPASVEDAAVVLRAFLGHKRLDINTKSEQGELLENAFRHILASGYDGILVVIDEMSEYMGRTRHPNEDEDCLLVLSSTLAKGKRMPIWTVVAAQEAYAKQDKLIGPDRMREEHLEHKAERFRNIVVNRCRRFKEIKGKPQVGETHNYYMGYREKIPWVQKVEEEAFQDCFPFPPEAIEVIQKIARKLTGTRSTISFLHAALQNAMKRDPNWNELIALWRVFDELMTYEESKSNSASGTISIKSIFKAEAAALDGAQTKLGKVEVGDLGKKAGKRRAERILNTLFLYHIGGYGGLTPSQILDAVCDLKGEDNADIQVAYYERILEEMKTVLSGQVRYREGRYEFTPKETTAIDELVGKAIEVMRNDPAIFWKYYDKFLGYSEGPDSPFAKYRGASLVKFDVLWHGQERTGHVGFRDLTVMGRATTPDAAGSESDFVIVLSTRTVSDKEARQYLKTDAKEPDPRVMVWIPASLTDEQKTALMTILAYLKIKEDHRDTKHEKEAKSNFQLLCDSGYDVLKQQWQQGKVFTTRKTLAIDWTGGLEGALQRVAGDALDNCYKAATVDMGRRVFGTEEAVKLINGLIRSGKAVSASDKLYSAVENFAKPLGLVKPSDPDKLNPSGSPFLKAIRDFAEEKGGHAVPLSVFYNRFTGWQPGDGEKSWGLTRRMVDIYLLALAQQGTVRINVKKGLPIDRSTIAGVDFKPEILRSFETVEVPKAWIEWDMVSQYLEVMTGAGPGAYGPKFDQSIAHEAIQRLQEVWVPKEKVDGLLERVSQLFRDLDQKDPYDTLLMFWLSFFDTPLAGESADEQYEDFKSHLLRAADKIAIEDLDKKDLSRFVGYWKSLMALQQNFDDLATLVRCAGMYARAVIPEIKEYKSLQAAIKKLGSLVYRASEFVVDPDRAHAELQPAMEAVWKEFEGPFAHGVSEINAALDELREAATTAGKSKDATVLGVLSDSVPDASKGLAAIEATVSKSKDLLFDDLPAGDDLSRMLHKQDFVRSGRGRNLHLCDLKPETDALKTAIENCHSIPGGGMQSAAAFLHDEKVRAKLQEHGEKKVVAGLLAEDDAPGIARYLLDLKPAQLDELAKVLKAVLKGTAFVTVRLSDFKPSQSTLWGEPEVDQTVAEFRSFLVKKGQGKVIKIE